MSVCVGPVPSEHQFRGGRQLSLERHVALCVSAMCAQPPSVRWQTLRCFENCVLGVFLTELIPC